MRARHCADARRLHLDPSVHHTAFLDEHELRRQVARHHRSWLKLDPIRRVDTSGECTAHDHLAGVNVPIHGRARSEDDGIGAADAAVETAIYTKRALRVDVTVDRELAVEQRVSAALCLIRGAGALGKKTQCILLKKKRTANPTAFGGTVWDAPVERASANAPFTCDAEHRTISCSGRTVLKR